MKTGERYGKLTAVRFYEYRGKYVAYWLFKCDCGNEHISAAHNVKAGASRSCGCLKIKCGFQKGDKHWAFKDGERDVAKNKLYRVWAHMIRRCNNPEDEGWENYGGRGIKVLWESYEEFRDDMMESFSVHEKEHGGRNTSLDRIDVNGDYCKENCRWATQKEQARNTRRTVYVDLRGEKKALADLRDEKGKLFANRIRNGWSEDDAEDDKLKSKPVDIGNMRKIERNYVDEKKRLMDLFTRSAQVVSTYLSVLEPRERFIIENRLGMKDGKRMTLESISVAQNCSRERVRQIEARAMEKMVRFYSELSR